ncbi:MAG: glycosyltransferase [Anaerolineae bacterium]|nr:glycosyltransferase [Anaerolineae bacterium]NIN98190.1 glycosyltransferase [Anaerolineae bacterium]NIQ81114.1 glycosyltransferase [Anaerolineae bacterium]
MKVLYKADFTSPSGYSRAARAHARALIEAGVDVLCEDLKHDIASIELDEFWSVELPRRVGRHERAPIALWHHTPEYYQPSPAQLNVGLVAWETSEAPKYDIPTARHNWTKQLNKMHAVWTFSQAAKRALEKAQVERPIDVTPHPIDHSIYHPGDDGAGVLYGPDREPLDDHFKFLSVFQWHARKDPYSLILAYLSEFHPDEKTALVLKTYVNKTGDIQSVLGQLERIKKGTRLPHDYARIFVVPSVLSDQEMAELYRSVDCYVSTSRGEGFCLPAAEALACGVPVIVPGASSFKDYVTENVGYLVKTHEEPVYGMPQLPWYYSTQNWHRTDILDLRRRMREAVALPDACKDRAEKAPGAVRAFSSEKVGQWMRSQLEALLAGASSTSTRAAPAVPESAGTPSA